MAWMKIFTFGLAWFLMTTASASALVPEQQSGAESAAKVGQSTMHKMQTGAAMKSFTEGYDSDSALKISQDAIGRSLEGYQFQDRRGRTVSLADYRGKPLLISMIYTSCFHICPTTTKNLAKAIDTVNSAVGEDAFHVITIGFDVSYDTPERMRSFARQQGVSGAKNWSFLSADKAAMDRLTTDLGFLYTPSSKGFDHLIQVTVVDGEGKIFRQIYGMEVDSVLLTGAMRELVFGTSAVAFDLSTFVSRVRLFCTTYDPTTDTYKVNYAMIFGMSVGAFLLTITGIFLVYFLRKW